MRIQKKCIPCIVNQAIKFSDASGIENYGETLKKVFELMSRTDYDRYLTPELVGEIFAVITQEAKNSDPYKETRRIYNDMILKQASDFELRIEESPNPFLTAVKYAIIGNIIDFSPDYDLSFDAIKGYFSRFGQLELAIDDTAHLRNDILKSDSLLYLGDNCGEICLDKILLKKIKEINPSCKIYFAVKGSPVVNDSVAEDAYTVGIDELAAVIDNGDSSLGTVLHRTSDEFREIFDKSDIIISKGQANYECLSDINKNIYFLLMAKCKVIADNIGTDEMSLVCKKQQSQQIS